MVFFSRHWHLDSVIVQSLFNIDCSTFVINLTKKKFILSIKLLNYYYIYLFHLYMLKIYTEILQRLFDICDIL